MPRALIVQEAKLHCDGWTPLMASTVADHADISQWLLQKAGQSAPAMVAATNRYGQSVLHIAARRGCIPLLELLIAMAPPYALGIRNAAGDTPATIAANLGHGEAAFMLRKVVSEQEGSGRVQLRGSQWRRGRPAKC